jgi:FixJ family two-component response regulator
MDNRARGKIFVIDDDESVRRSISLLLKSAGYLTETFENVAEFLTMDNYPGTGCILLDIFMDGESGLELQDIITKKYTALPVIYITGYGDIPMTVQAFKKGAINFLQKPLDDRKLFMAVDEALGLSAAIVTSQMERARLKSLIDTLTTREFEIFRNVITGMLNKQIAAKLNIAEHTVKLHRGRITEKLGLKSVAELVSLAEKLNIK